MFELQRKGITQAFRLPKPTMKQSLMSALVFSVQVIVCSLLLKWGYTRVNKPGVSWAIISAIIVLQPGIEASVATSVARIGGNTVGAVIAVTVGKCLGDGTWQLLLAITLTAFACESLRLDLGVRAACVSVVIILSLHERNFVMSSVDRSVSVGVGSVVAVLMQTAGAGTKRLIFRISAPAPPVVLSAETQPVYSAVHGGSSGMGEQ